jgi:hypothetical protein
MGFHISPFSEKAQTIFMFNRPGLLKPRIPIAERALQARENLAISFDTALECSDQVMFSIYHNTFEVLRDSEAADERTAALAVSHFGSIFVNSFIHMSMRKSTDSTYELIIKAFKDDVYVSPMISNYENDFETGKATLLIIPETKNVSLFDLATKEGFGGQLVAAIYNFSQDLSMESITFDILLNNTKAMQFYYHTDFGEQVGRDESTEFWRLEIESLRA